MSDGGPRSLRYYKPLASETARETTFPSRGSQDDTGHV